MKPMYVITRTNIIYFISRFVFVSEYDFCIRLRIIKLLKEKVHVHATGLHIEHTVQTKELRSESTQFNLFIIRKL
jgi:hypothetical protein